MRLIFAYLTCKMSIFDIQALVVDSLDFCYVSLLALVDNPMNVVVSFLALALIFVPFDSPSLRMCFVL